MFGTLLSELKEKIAQNEELPYCSGTATLNPTSSSLFFMTAASNATVLNFAQPTDAQIEVLANACQPATFGINQKDVLDESYRKAGKMDADKFVTQFSLYDLGIMDFIKEFLLQGRDEQPFQAELYKLNVYGPGAFFKSHVDTPRSDTMFGSLVVVLPTVHEGGSLVFRHDEKEWTFESSKSVKTNPPQVAFAAFFSDVEHEVLPVISGYRVTLTYNLYFSKTSDVKAAVALGDPTANDDIKASLGRLLKDPDFLPDGGSLGFGLSHKYSFNYNTTQLGDILKRLKGSDAGLKQLCEAVSLKVSVKAIYRGENYSGKGEVFCLLNEFFDFRDSGETENGLIDYLSDTRGATKVYDPEDGRRAPDDAEPIIWVKSLANVNRFESSYIAYGNEASMGCAYGEVCLVATVPPAEKRIT